MKKYQLSDLFTNYDLLKLTSFFAKDYGTCLLYSGGCFKSVKYSYLFLFPLKSFAVTHLNCRKKFENFENVIKTQDVFGLLDQKVKGHLWSGFLSYEMGAFSDENLTTPFKESNFPLAYFQRCLITIEYNHQNSKICLYLEDDDNSICSKRQLDYANKMLNLKEFLTQIPDIRERPIRPAKLLSQESKENYLAKIISAKEHIKDGNYYQINLSHEIKFQTSSEYFDIFYHLATNDPSPFSAYFYFGDMAIVCNSPERLIKKERSILEAKPIKGTVSRGSSEKEDQSNIMKLISSEKERAELVMITDLLRNDLAKISTVGSIETELNQVEKYKNVFHSLSIIKSKANPTLSNIEILKALFPGGSITGCPKIEAKKIIYQLEDRARRIYTGSIGYLKGIDNFDFNICIRTILFHNNEASVQLGGAIVADSDPLSEYRETIIKGRSLFKALNYQNDL